MTPQQRKSYRQWCKAFVASEKPKTPGQALLWAYIRDTLIKKKK